MADFMIRFLICNVPISAITGILLLAKHLFKNHLSSRNGNLYGKTGTGNINAKILAGGSLVLLKLQINIYFFALNIGAADEATGSKATNIALSILSNMNIWQSNTPQ